MSSHVSDVRRTQRSGKGAAVRQALRFILAFTSLATVVSVASASASADTPGPDQTGSVEPLDPARLLETRSGGSTVDGKQHGVGRVGAGKTVELAVTGRGGVVSNASAVMLNVTAVNPAAAGYLTVFPCGGGRPHASNVNFAAGDVAPNAVLSAVGDGGKVCVYTTAATDLVVDVNAAFTPGSVEPTDDAPPTEDAPEIEASGEGVFGSSAAGDFPFDVEIDFDIPPAPAGTYGGVPDLDDHEVALDEFSLSIRERGDEAGQAQEWYAGERPFVIGSAGYPQQTHPAIGRLIMWRRVNGTWQIASSCSGTVVDRTMVLTAAHCLGVQNGRVWDGYTFIPGLRGHHQPKGVWAAAGNRAYYEPTLDRLSGISWWLFDYALIKFDPKYNGGNYLGDYTGMFPVLQGGASLTTKHAYGYPAEGYYSWESNRGWCSGRLTWCYPYMCRSTDGDSLNFGNGWRLMGYGCNANGGFSGGPVFGYHDGRWWVISVNSHGGRVMNRNNQHCVVRQICSWYMQNSWGPEFKSGWFDKFYYAVKAL